MQLSYAVMLYTSGFATGTPQKPSDDEWLGDGTVAGSLRSPGSVLCIDLRMNWTSFRTRVLRPNHNYTRDVRCAWDVL